MKFKENSHGEPVVTIKGASSQTALEVNVAVDECGDEVFFSITEDDDHTGGVFISRKKARALAKALLKHLGE